MLIILIVLLVIIGLFIYLNKEPKSYYQEYLEKELERNPDYINWLKYTNGGRDYKKALKILKKIESDENNLYRRWLREIRKL